jgi:hypothetical protein
MSNLSDLMKDIFSQEGDTIKGAGDILGTLADLGGSIQLAVSAVELFVGQDSQLQDILNAITEDFQQVDQLISAGDKLARMRDVDLGINPAEGVFQQLPQILTGPQLSQEYILEQIQICLDALNFFSNYDDKWQVAYGEFPYYSDGWSGSLAPSAPGDGLVFNYTYTLPQFLRAIYIFLTTVNSLAPSSLPTYAPALQQAAGRLQTIHDTVVTGIVPTRVPGPFDVGWVQDPYTEGQQYNSSWYTSNLDLPWPYGAVELYSGANNVNSYITRVSPLLPDSTCWLDLGFYSVGLPDPDYIPEGQFLSLLELRIAMAKKHLYLQLGMLTLRQTINQLNQITGQPLLGGDSYNACRPAEAGAILGIDLPTPGSTVLTTLSDWLAATPPYCGGRMYCPSSRKLFEFAGPPVPGPAVVVAEVLGDQGVGWPSVSASVDAAAALLLLSP